MRRSALHLSLLLGGCFSPDAPADPGSTTGDPPATTTGTTAPPATEATSAPTTTAGTTDTTLDPATDTSTSPTTPSAPATTDDDTTDDTTATTEGPPVNPPMPFVADKMFGLSGAVAVGRLRLSGDVIDDFVATSELDSNLHRFTGSLDSISETSPFPTAGPSPALAVYDFDGNGLDDVAVVHPDPPGSIQVFSSSGGDFYQSSNVAFADTCHPTDIAVAQLDADGFPDLVFICPNEGDYGIWRGAAGGIFAADALLYPTGLLATMVAVADVSGNGGFDGAPDLILGSETQNLIQIHEGLGNGAFAIAVAREVDIAAPHALTIGRLDGDEHLDIVVASTNADTCTILRSGPDTWPAPKPFPCGQTPTDVLLVDLNDDAFLDLATTHTLGQAPGSLHLSFNDGDGLVLAAETTTAIGPHALASGDFNGDAAPDLVVASVQYVQVFLADG